MLLFLQSLLFKQYSWSYVQKTLAGVSFFLKLHNQPSCFTFFSVQQALKGYKKNHFHKDRRLPITPLILEKICSVASAICFSSFESILFRAVFSLAFFAALRVSELNVIQVSDVFLSATTVKIFIRRSKTDQYGKGVWIELFPCANQAICPVGLLQNYSQVRPPGGHNFFLHESGAPLTKYQFLCVFKKCLKALNLQDSHLTSHSFRIGAATEAARLGLDTEFIKKVGRWRSNSYLLYVRPNHSFNSL